MLVLKAFSANAMVQCRTDRVNLARGRSIMHTRDLLVKETSNLAYSDYLLIDLHVMSCDRPMSCG